MKRKKKKRLSKRKLAYKQHIAEVRAEKKKQQQQRIVCCHPDIKKRNYSAFYKTQAWKELRYIALGNSDGRCQCCGAKASDGVTLHVDHILPRSKYPQLELNLDNLQILCDDCNIGKGNWDMTNWKKHFDTI